MFPSAGVGEHGRLILHVDPALPHLARLPWVPCRQPAPGDAALQPIARVGAGGWGRLKRRARYWTVHACFNAELEGAVVVTLRFVRRRIMRATHRSRHITACGQLTAGSIVQ